MLSRGRLLLNSLERKSSRSTSDLFDITRAIRLASSSHKRAPPLPFHTGALVDGEFRSLMRENIVLDQTEAAIDVDLADKGILLEDLRHLANKPITFDSIDEVKRCLYGSSNLPILLPRFDDDYHRTGHRRQYLIERLVHLQGIQLYRTLTESMLGMGMMANLSDASIRKTWSSWIEAVTARLSQAIESTRIPSSSKTKPGAYYDSSVRGAISSRKGVNLIASLNMQPEHIARAACVAFTSEVCNPSPGKSSVVTGRGSKGQVDDDSFASQTRSWTNSDLESSMDSSLIGKAPFIHLCDTVASALVYESNYQAKSAPVIFNQEDKFLLGSEIVRIILSECFVRVVKSSPNEILDKPSTRSTKNVFDPERDLYAEDVPMESFAPPIGAATTPLVTYVHAFRHIVERRGFKSSGYIVMEPELAQIFSALMPGGSFFKLPPMIVPPCKWASFWRSGFMTRRLPLIRYTGIRDPCRDARVSDMSHIMKCMDYLGSTKWVVNNQILAIIEEAIQLTDTASPLKIPGIAALVAQEKPAVISKGKVGRRTDLLQQLREKQKQENERPILLSKLRIARDLQHARALYFPHSIDFRGRAYPIPAPFNHQGDDICRSLLRFGDKKRLGPRGWFWLRVHAANMFGVDKVTFDDRLKWVDENMEKIILLANEPFAAKSLEFVNSHTDDFWQAVNVASEIRDAVISGNPEEFMSNLPIHQDGSCNGLQHYAALGRDSFGAKAVNIVPSEKVEDVYTVVLNMVKERIRQDAQRNVGGVDDNIECPSQFAHLKSGQGVPALARQALASAEILQRKTVKQTVMTICYGVTQIGASDQVHKQLKELGIAKKLSSAQVAVLSSYIARTILGSIDEVFKQAMQIKKWFDTVAVEMNKHEIPVAWISPAGVVCRQPYRKQKMTEIRTLVQKITIVDEEEYDKAPISAAKQRLGFPPNFVHSLDASHMMLTTNACKEAGLTFAAVHDSFWTHACDVDTMNVIIREEFYKMYSEPILEKLRDSLVTRLGENGHNIPPLPQQGDLDLKCVLESPFFFD